MKYLKKIYFVLLIAFLLSSNLTSQENTKNESIDLNEYLGARLYKVFQTFSCPQDVFCSADGKNETILDYGTFAFQIGKKEVTIVYFWENFPGKVFGVKMGMSQEEISKQYGEPTLRKRSTADNNPIWIYYLKKTDRMFIVFFDKNNKIFRMQIEWLG